MFSFGVCSSKIHIGEESSLLQDSIFSHASFGESDIGRRQVCASTHIDCGMELDH